jgi:hypothetical protein
MEEGEAGATGSAGLPSTSIDALLIPLLQPASCGAVLAQLDGLSDTEALEAIAAVVLDRDFDGTRGVPWQAWPCARCSGGLTHMLVRYA